MNLLITGGLGFIGSNFIRYILNKYPSYWIINLDIVSYCANFENLRDVENNPHYRFIKGDICDEKIVDNILCEKPDAIVNFAAESHVDRSIMGADDFLKTNVVGTYTLLKLARKHKVKRFVHIGTDEEYGSIRKGSFRETDNLNPSNPYSASKAAASLLALSFFKTHKMPVVITRSSNNFGPYQFPEKIIPLFITNLFEGKKVPLYGAGKNIRDWIYVLDNCSGIDFVLHKGKVGEVYNIGGGNEKTNLELTKIILSELGKSEDWIEYVTDRPGHDFRYALEASKIRKLGWQPRYVFTEAIKETIRWYQKNQDWWKKIKSGEYSEYYKRQYLKRS